MSIPVVDIRDFSDPARREAFIQTLGQGLEEFGFVAVEGHGVPADALERAYEVAVETFALPEDIKRRYENLAEGRQRGYTAFGVEHAKDNPTPDLKEFWHVGPELSPEHPLSVRGAMPRNIFPAEVETFKPTFMALFNHLQGFAFHLLEAIGVYLGLAPDFFTSMATDGNSVLRIINYPDMGVDVPVGAVRASAHEDINLITVLPASTRPGLELMTRDGEWMPLNAPPNVMICDTGDMMQLVTAGRLPATTHRVVNPEGADGGRLSMPFFVHPHPDHVLTPITPGYADPILTTDFLARRLREIGVG